MIAARIDATLDHRIWSVPSLDGRPRCHAFLVAHGRAAFVADDEEGIDLTPPAILWLPRSARGGFTLAAGGDGAMVAIADDLVVRIVGDSPDSVRLRPLLGRMAVAPADRIAPHLGEVTALFAAIRRESRQQQADAAAMMAHYIGLILLHLRRASGLGPATATHGGVTIVDHFRQLIELHYRENLRIDQFAGLLGVTRGYLHQACLRATGRTPLALVHDRLIEEARLRLEQTGMPVEQVAYSLGFRDAAYFNRFFKRLTGQSPGAFRQMAARPRGEAPSFAAWP